MSKTYQMNLADIPFSLIESGKKRIEMRLCSKDRGNIVPGDLIVFDNDKKDYKLVCEVISVSRFKDFHELYNHFPKEMLGYLDSEKARPDDMLIYYKRDDINKYGVLGIEIKLINK